MTGFCPLKGQHHYHQLSFKTTPDPHINPRARSTRRNQTCPRFLYALPELRL